jgi:maltooligosyltrehalose trehalohydrolase
VVLPGSTAVTWERAAPTSGIPPHRFVVCIQNHDQVGNRALGSRLNADVDLPTYLAATVLLLSAPETPLLFMGQEWAATSPFLYFTDHHPELGRKVTEGRRRSSGVPEFADEARVGSRPQAASTFEASR